ncbi:MAG: hypothetical protein K6F31_09865, partial [Acetatifactor sp.]|nr:hypothetical protein [Acetatifactor sp.]
MMKKAKSRHIGSRLLSILLALVLVLTNFGGTFPGKAKADGEGDEGKYTVTTKAIINRCENDYCFDTEGRDVITGGAGSYGAGEKVTISVKSSYEKLPDYFVDRVFYNDGTADHEITKDADGKYSFIMPENNVTVTVHVIRFKEWTSTNSLPTTGNYYLRNDVQVRDFTVSGDLNLCLNGRSIRILGTLKINEKVRLNLFATGENEDQNPIEVRSELLVNGTLNVYGGTISNGHFNEGISCSIAGGQLGLFAGTIDLNHGYLDLSNGGKIDLVGGSFENGTIGVENSQITLSEMIFAGTVIRLKKENDVISITGKLPTDAKYEIEAGKYPHVITSGLKGNGDVSNFVSADKNHEVVLNDDGEAMLISKRGEIFVQANLLGREWTDEDEFTFTISPKGSAPAPEKSKVTIKKNTENHRESFGKIMFSEEGTYEYTISQTHKGETIKGVSYDAEDKTITITVKKEYPETLVADEGSTLTPTATFTNAYGYKVTTKGILNRSLSAGYTEDVESDAVITAGAGYYGAGDKVTLTVDSKYEEAPDNSTSYYLIDQVFYNDGTADHEITKDADGKYSFIMPESNVTVTAHVIKFEPWDSSTSLPTGGNYYLTEGVSVDNWVINSDMNLCLNSQKVEVKDRIFIYYNTLLNLFDNESGGSTGNGEIEAYEIVIHGGTLNVYGGTIDSHNCNISQGQLCLINGHINPADCCYIEVKDGSKIDLAGGSITNADITVSGSEIELSGTIFTDTKSCTIDLEKKAVINITGKLPTDAKYKVWADEYPYVITSGLKGNGDASNFVSYNSSCEVVLNEDGEAEIISKRAEISVQANLEGREWTNTDEFTFTLAKADDPEKVIDTVTIDKNSENHTASFKISFDDAGKYSYVISQENKGQTNDKLTYDVEEKTVTITVEKRENGTIVAASGSTLTPT